MFVTGGADQKMCVWDTNSIAMPVAVTVPFMEAIHALTLWAAPAALSLVAVASASPHLKLCDLRAGAGVALTFFGHHDAA